VLAALGAGCWVLGARGRGEVLGRGRRWGKGRRRGGGGGGAGGGVHERSARSGSGGDLCSRRKLRGLAAAVRHVAGRDQATEILSGEGAHKRLIVSHLGSRSPLPLSLLSCRGVARQGCAAAAATADGGRTEGKEQEGWKGGRLGKGGGGKDRGKQPLQPVQAAPLPCSTSREGRGRSDGGCSGPRGAVAWAGGIKLLRHSRLEA